MAWKSVCESASLSPSFLSVIFLGKVLTSSVSSAQGVGFTSSDWMEDRYLFRAQRLESGGSCLASTQRNPCGVVAIVISDNPLKTGPIACCEESQGVQGAASFEWWLGKVLVT